MGFFDDIARTRARGAELIRGPRRKTSDRPLESGVTSASDRPSYPSAPASDPKNLLTGPRRVVQGPHAGSPRSSKATPGWNEGSRGQLVYLLIGLVSGALIVVLARSDAMRDLRISVARTFLPDDLEVKPLEKAQKNSSALGSREKEGPRDTTAPLLDTRSPEFALRAPNESAPSAPASQASPAALAKGSPLPDRDPKKKGALSREAPQPWTMSYEAPSGVEERQRRELMRLEEEAARR